MKTEGHVEIYRIAYEAATSELTEISAEVQRLEIRKEQIERLIAVLKPLFGEEPDASQQVSAEGPAQQEEAKEAAGEGNMQHEPFTADPFQRRIDHVLGIGAGIRDVRKYSRQF